MKFIWTTTIRDVQDHSPVLSGRKIGNESILEYGKKVKRIVTTDNIAFQVDDEDGLPAKGAQLRITIETL